MVVTLSDTWIKLRRAAHKHMHIHMTAYVTVEIGIHCSLNQAHFLALVFYYSM